MRKWKWGDWVEARAYFVGLKSRRAIERAFDVSPRHLARWLRMENPPGLQRRSYDMLQRALCLSEEWSVTECYKYGEPDFFEIEGVPLSLSEPSGGKRHESGDAQVRREIKAIAEALSGDLLLAMHKEAKRLMADWLCVDGDRSKLGIAAKPALKPHTSAETRSKKKR